MSLYYEGYLAFDLVPEIPTQIVDILNYLTRKEDYSFNVDVENDFFSTKEWRTFLQITNEASSLPGKYWCEFKRVIRYQKNGEDHYRYTFSLRRMMHDDVEWNILWWNFIYWIAQYVETEGFIGFTRETFSIHPIIIYLHKGKVYKLEISGNPEGWYGEIWDGDPKLALPGWMKE